MEETRTYNLTVFSYLIDKGYFFLSENELKLRKTKTDKKDAYKLAE